MKMKYMIGMILVAVMMLVALSLPWAGAFDSEGKIDLFRLAVFVFLYVLVITGVSLVGAGERKKYEGKPFESLEDSRKYTILGIVRIGDNTHLFLEPERDIGNIINFARKSEELPEDLKEGLIITQTEDDKISILK